MTDAKVTMSTVAPACWICGSPADSREHFVKRGALAVLFPKHIDPKIPIHVRSGTQKKTIGSLKSDSLKFPKNTCQMCNSTRTQANDDAWQHLIETVHRECCPLHPGDRINLWKVFPNSPAKGMINVQLYLAKVMGCTIKESGEGFDLRFFSSAILTQSPHQHLYLKFATMPGIPKHAGQSLLKIEGTCAALIHTVGELSVIILHALDGESQGRAQNAWHPSILNSSLSVNLL